MFLKTLYSDKPDFKSRKADLIAHISRFKVPKYSDFSAKDLALTSGRIDNLFTAIAASTGEQKADVQEMHRRVIQTSGVAYSGFTGIIDSDIFLPDSGWDDDEVSREESFKISVDDSTNIEIWALGSDITSHYYLNGPYRFFTNSYTFLQIDNGKPSERIWQERVGDKEPQLSSVRYPVFVLGHDFLKLLDDMELRHEFEIALHRLTQRCAHDPIHHYFFPSTTTVRSGKMADLTATLCANIHPGREQKNIEHIALMLNLVEFQHDIDRNSREVSNLATNFLNLRNKIMAKCDDPRTREGIRVLCNSMAILLVSGFAPKEKLLATVDHRYGEWEQILKENQHKHRPTDKIFVDYSDRELAAALKRENRDYSHLAVRKTASEIAQDMIGEWKQMGNYRYN